MPNGCRPRPRSAEGGSAPSRGAGSPSGRVEGTTCSVPPATPRRRDARAARYCRLPFRGGFVTELVHNAAARGVATLTLDSPHNRNALSPRLMAELAAGLRAALADDAVRVVVLTSADRVFCSGMDL